jgi:lysyl-tRNA synthetase class 2
MSEDVNWQPSASLEVLKQRARMLQKLRAFFSVRDVLEVETPMMSRAGTTDPNIDSFRVSDPGFNWQGYLHTSPEFSMKRLLAAGSGSIYQVCKVFRRGEQGKQHNPEFTMLEWYRVGFDHYQLMQEVDDLVRDLLNESLELQETQSFSYQQLFEQQLGLNPHTSTVEQLKLSAAEHNCPEVIGLDEDKNAWLDILMTHVIEPAMPKNCPVFIYNFPTLQASLARIQGNVAERFELYINGMELANGFHELTEAKEQRQRFERDNQQRQQRGKQPVSIDENFLIALEQGGLPGCAGVALGLDRLMMLISGASQIDDIVSFTFKNA